MFKTWVHRHPSLSWVVIAASALVFVGANAIFALTVFPQTKPVSLVSPLILVPTIIGGAALALAVLMVILKQRK